MSIPEQPFGFVAGRWVLSLADTPMDSDRAPDYAPLHPGSVVFNNKLSHRVVNDGPGTVGIVKTRIEATLNEDGRIVDAEEHEFVALPVGVYSVTFSFGQYSWPNFDIEVKSEHTIDSPLWLPSKSPIPSGPGVVHVVSEEARLAAEAAAASAWEAVDTPGRQGIPGPPGKVVGGTQVVNVMDSRDYHLTTYAHATGTRVPLAPGHKYYATRNYSGPTTNASGSIRAGNPAHVFINGYESSAVTTYSGEEVPNGLVYIYGDRDEPHSYTDVVLVDLTETFGSGNEPDLVYMDNLVRREGGWFDTSSPIVGNAFAENVVLGSGMGLRQDTTVGTRVLLDHPYGTTMLHGDTGWWTLPPGGWTIGTFQIRRVGSTVSLRLGDMESSGAEPDIPFGFRPPTSTRWHAQAAYSGGSSSQTSTLLMVYRTLRIVGTITEKLWATVPAEFTWSTTEPWPTELPGTPIN